MADTIQSVRWTLAQRCPLRPGDDWDKPQTALSTLADLQTHYFQLRKNSGKPFGDVCVTSVTCSWPVEGRYYDYPGSGIIFSSPLSGRGGLAALRHLCGHCPANGDREGLAGCAGIFALPLYPKEWEEQLVRLVDRLGRSAKLDSCFPRTNPHWFRFWINTPLERDAAKALHQFLEAVLDEDDHDLNSSRRKNYGSREGLGEFIWALDCSVTHNIPLQVDVTPPGHTDFGLYTIFPHCPRCKAGAPVKRWRRKYKDEELVCSVCGQRFSPAKTHSVTRDEWDRDDLRDILGQAEFEKFAAQYLMAQGATETEAAELVRKHEEQEQKRQEEGKQRLEASKRHRRFVEEVLYQGLKSLSSGDEDEGRWLFSAADVEEILRRCKTHGAKASYIAHISEIQPAGVRA